MPTHFHFHPLIYYFFLQLFFSSFYAWFDTTLQPCTMYVPYIETFKKNHDIKFLAWLGIVWYKNKISISSLFFFYVTYVHMTLLLDAITSWHMLQFRMIARQLSLPNVNFNHSINVGVFMMSTLTLRYIKLHWILYFTEFPGVLCFLRRWLFLTRKSSKYLLRNFEHMILSIYWFYVINIAFTFIFCLYSHQFLSTEQLIILWKYKKSK